MKRKVPYIKYNELEEFYTIKEACKLFQMEKAQLKEACERYKISPIKNDIGEAGFTRYDIRKLHNALYHEDDPDETPPKKDDLWDD